MKTITTLLTFLVFILIVFRKRIAGSLKKRMDKKETGQKELPAPAAPVSASGNTAGSSTGIKVFVFDYANFETASSFADFIDAKLSLFFSQTGEERVIHTFNVMPSGTVFIVFIIYEVLEGVAV